MYLSFVDPVIPIDPIIPHAVEPVVPVVPHIVGPLAPSLLHTQVAIPVVHTTVLPCAETPPGIQQMIIMLAVVGLGLMVWLVVQTIREWHA
jgi:hypothetical protein